jgi:hypothetical protein
MCPTALGCTADTAIRRREGTGGAETESPNAESESGTRWYDDEDLPVRRPVDGSLILLISSFSIDILGNVACCALAVKRPRKWGAYAATWRIWWTATITMELSSGGAVVTFSIIRDSRSYGSDRALR